MDQINTLFAILTGLALRLAIPILITALAVYFLRRLDEHWQVEGETIPMKIDKPECWKVTDCAPEERAVCPGYLSPLPCWQVKRLPNGYLREECLDCQVFRAMPAPIHA